MRSVHCSLVLGVFGFSCWLSWAMLTLMSEVRDAGRVLPWFTTFCVALRPMLAALPLLALAYYLWLWLRKDEKLSHWMGFVGATMTVLIVLVLPAMLTSYLLMVDQVRTAVGIR